MMKEKLLPHRGHNIACVCYGEWSDPADVCIECEDCSEVLVSSEDWDAPTIDSNNAPEFIGQIIDIFDDFLEEKGICIENPEKDEAEDSGQDPEGLAIIYGTDYGNLQTQLEDVMAAWGILKGGRS